jgi:hypothetical protein
MGLPGSFSPVPLVPTAYAGQDVLPEEEDLRLLELTRAQVGGPCGVWWAPTV